MHVDWSVNTAAVTTNGLDFSNKSYLVAKSYQIEMEKLLNSKYDKL